MSRRGNRRFSHPPEPGEEPSVRGAREEDAESIVELLNPIIRAGVYTILDRPVSVEDQIAFLRGIPERGVCHVATDAEDGCVLGIQDVVPHSPGSGAFDHVGEVSTFVSLDHRGKGIGRLLSAATLREARKQGFLKICATIRADNPGAVAFYTSQGFRVIGTARKHARVGERYLDEILMEKVLDEPS
jgi:L-amino acid N-acyltransferase YncA